MQKIAPFLWFDPNAEDAVDHDASVLRNSRVVHVTRDGEHGPGPKGQAALELAYAGEAA